LTDINQKNLLNAKTVVLGITDNGPTALAIDFKQGCLRLKEVIAPHDDNNDTGQNWQSFLEQLEPLKAREPEDTNLAVCFDGRNAAFYRVNIPVTDNQQLESIIKIRAESLLPIDSSKMRFSWRCDREIASSRNITIAAGSRNIIDGFAASVSDLKPDRITVDHEAMVAAFEKYTEDLPPRYILTFFSKNCTKVCAVEAGLLVNAITIDTGTDNLFEDEQTIANTAEMFTQDICSGIDYFGPDFASVQAFILCPNHELGGKLSEFLAQTGLNTQLPKILITKLIDDQSVTPEQFIEWLPLLGTALLNETADENQLNLFEQVYLEKARESALRGTVIAKRTSIAAVVIILLILLGVFIVDYAQLWYLKDKLAYESQGINVARLIKRHRTHRQIASARPDMIELLSIIAEAAPSAMVIDNINYRRGQAVTISGQVPNHQTLEQFHKALREHKDVKDAQVGPATKSKNDKKLNFSVTFGYKNFTTKRRSPSISNF
jgi:hypothetical protein